MMVNLTGRPEQQVHDLLRYGAYTDAESVVADAVDALPRERERHQLEVAIEEHGIDERRIEELLTEAAASGDYTEMTPRDWADIEREGLALDQTRKSA